MADPGMLSVSAISIGQTVAAYQFLLPRLSEVRRTDSTDPGMRGDVLLGQVAAGSVSMAVGSLLAWMSGSAVPVYVTIVIAAIIAGTYHYAMRSVDNATVA